MYILFPGSPSALRAYHPSTEPRGQPDPTLLGRPARSHTERCAHGTASAPHPPTALARGSRHCGLGAPGPI
eukprot:scaffold7233_cov570-Prasinococcus_capsulatus_cf.AAC.10